MAGLEIHHPNRVGECVSAAVGRFQWYFNAQGQFGPAMEYKLQNWSAVQPLLQQGSKLLTVPLTVWRTCVQQLQAPPSAGVLMLCWLQELLGGRLAGVRVAGVGGHKPGQPYATLNAQQGRISRHDWLAEQFWLDAAGVNTQANVAAGLPEPLQSATLFATN